VKASADTFVERLLEGLGTFNVRMQRQKWIEELKKIYERWRKEFDMEADEGRNTCPLEPSYVAHEIIKNAPANTIFVSEGGGCGMWCWAHLWTNGPVPFVFPVQMGTIGVTIPMAIGAKIAQQRAAIWGIMGDGASFYHVTELRTLKKLGIPAVFFIFNDRAWGAVRMAQMLAFGRRYIGVDLPDVDFATIAQGLGCVGIRVQTPEELSNAIRGVKSADIPTVVDVVIKRDTVPYIGLNFAVPEMDGVMMSIAGGGALGISSAFLRGMVKPRQARFLAEYIGLADLIMDPRKLMEMVKL
jgi:thiamine pyrophosphate-dependent acetolactate synthase large subunit-like protein